ncbi:uncharacterized protein LOC118281113 [Spodoptera frugiperda]|uniref:Uncharacterized protein LOC118281113 n=1 Tax=Spodoptera frugiperda TaxID=7108 RepID=A0A9R0EZE7_SPOFR|nr:uncharacterized protein LOC118281113 [Spodoptera frugiperda]
MDDKPECSRDIQSKKSEKSIEDEQPTNSKAPTKTILPNINNILTTDQTICILNKIPSNVFIKEQPTVSLDQPRRSQIGTPDEESHSPQAQTDKIISLQAPTEQSLVIKDQPNLPKYQTVASGQQVISTLGNSSGRRSPGNLESGIPFCLARVASTTLSYSRNNSYLSSFGPLIIRSSTQSPITTQPLSQLPLPTSVAVTAQPQTLFLQALSKLKESSLTLSVLSNLRLLQPTANGSKVINLGLNSGDITPPDSLTSAPPSYSFVLRQMAIRRRPRFMGTFFPSPSFVLHTPPPTYTTAFDVYIEPALPPPPSRVYTFGYTSMPMVCPECGYTGMTVITSRITICTHLCAFLLCLLCCWICAPLPYILKSCKDVYHYCRNCRSFLGMYCPTNPESVYQ